MKLTANRQTDETTVQVDLDAGSDALTVDLHWEAHGGLDEALEEGMAEHLFTALVSYAGLGGRLEASGDLAHHVVEDAAITLGTALRDRVENDPIQRFAEATVPMDEALVQTVLDAGGRPYFEGDLEAFSPLFHHVARTLAFESRSTLHVRVLRGADAHHVVEATMKALGMCLAEALAEAESVRSTKGDVELG